jgi:hypothetical protein
MQPSKLLFRSMMAGIVSSLSNSCNLRGITCYGLKGGSGGSAHFGRDVLLWIGGLCRGRDSQLVVNIVQQWFQ